MKDAAKNPQGNPDAHAPGQPVVAVIGDGQLARMMHTAAIELGQSVRLLAGSPKASAAQVVADVVVGDYRDREDLRAAARGASAVTFDHEHVPSEHLRALIEEGISVQPRPEALLYAQDKLAQRRRLRELGFPVPRFSEVASVAQALDFHEEVEGRVCLKACRGGYDGHGVWFPEGREELAALVEDLLATGVALMAEEKVNFRCELSAMVARTPSGEVATWPVVESQQKDGICHRAIAPAPTMSAQDDRALRTLAEDIAARLGVTGVLAVELFDTGGSYWVNELAMRPHNTGHWTQDGSATSQFEQHLRAVLDLPLGDTAPTAPVTVMVNTLGGPEDPAEPLPERMAQVWRRFPAAKIHLYGKEHRPGRKLGHVNLCGRDVATTVREADLAAYYLVHGRWADGWVPAAH
ncbi:5-(carboxyamino)imidazole ribonucleotide synthase [Corynebacterium sp. zg-331]|uniref:5-(carboxyamino)imidazole ribonucleotide synthase n=1 Tax=unclassified Corynebacterium TaxID=2624378 RepID=UPI001400C2B4|nr:5-(carboxyamino)imidazole ribonucleotide synthase [Corynebacterium sp. zg-331]MPV52406.1 5-(carboxyamino)imidazole ribonucleotide synthase [Corynebacterium sp. zg331]